MADTEIRVERWENGVLVDTQTVAKHPEQWAEETLLERATAALAANAAFLDTPNASITNAMALQQIKALTRQVNGLVRLQLRALDTVDDA